MADPVALPVPLRWRGYELTARQEDDGETSWTFDDGRIYLLVCSAQRVPFSAFATASCAEGMDTVQGEGGGDTPELALDEARAHLVQQLDAMLRTVSGMGAESHPEHPRSRPDWRALGQALAGAQTPRELNAARRAWREAVEREPS